MVEPTRCDGLGHGRNRGVSDGSSVFWPEQLEVRLSERRKSLGVARRLLQRHGWLRWWRRAGVQV